MPEIKHNFAGGKMNKDLDERLVPNGQYRDAMNVQVSTSDGSAVGTVQNLLSNYKLPGNDAIIGPNRTCLGSVANEKDNSVYWFVGAGEVNADDIIMNAPPTTTPLLAPPPPGIGLGLSGPSGPQPPSKVGFFNPLTSGGSIIEFKDSVITPVVIEASDAIISLVDFTDWGGGVLEYIVGSGQGNLLNVGMQLTGYSTIDANYSPSDPAVLTNTVTYGTPPVLVAANSTTNSFQLDFSPADLLTDIANGEIIALYFSSPVGAGHKPPLNFQPNTIITGINIIDDMLFWTDNHNEPKKINIPRCKEGTKQQTVNTPTGPVTSYSYTRFINYRRQITYGLNIPLAEKHVTVIRKSPSSAPTLDLKISRDHGLSENQLPQVYTGVVTVTTDPFPAAQTDDLGDNVATLDPYDFSGVNIGDEINLNIDEDIYGHSEFELLWPAQVGTSIVIKEFDEDGSAPGTPITDYRLRGTLLAWYGSLTATAGSPITIKLEITSISGFPPGPIEGETERKYAVDLWQQDERLFEFKFPRFGTRYKYADGEYSAFSPFSPVAFVPGAFDYHPKKGYNLGMTNKLTEVGLRNFRLNDTPLDVVEIDILFKEDSSPNVYVVDSIKKDSTETYWDDDEYILTHETIKGAVPSNQLLRSWDNVPKIALAQEITGNRIVYGNYTQGWDVFDATGNPYSPEFKWDIIEEDNSMLGWNINQSSAVRSVKSLREYQLGVVFIDEYGRETPVISNPTGTFTLDHKSSVHANRLRVGFNGSPPENQHYYKFYLKETSGEYYNLAMDRWFDAADGNVWLSFASSDRNKVDIDTFLLLKKAAETNEGVESKVRYKILAIENEAPDYVKTKVTRIVRQPYNSGATDPIFPPGSITGVPLSGRYEFQMGYAAFDNTSGSKLHEIDDGVLYVSFGKSGTTATSDRYRITSITTDLDPGASTPITASDASYFITIDGFFGEDLNFITDDPTGQSMSQIEDGTIINIYKHKVENSPIFDGKFFVKIYKDESFKNYVQGGLDITSSIEYRAFNYRKVYSMRANHETLHRRRATGHGLEPSGYTGSYFGTAESAYSGTMGLYACYFRMYDYGNEDHHEGNHPVNYDIDGYAIGYVNPLPLSRSKYRFHSPSNNGDIDITTSIGPLGGAMVREGRHSNASWFNEFYKYTGFGHYSEIEMPDLLHASNVSHGATLSYLMGTDQSGKYKEADNLARDHEVWFLDMGKYRHRHANTDELNWFNIPGDNSTVNDTTPATSEAMYGGSVDSSSSRWHHFKLTLGPILRRKALDDWGHYGGGPGQNPISDTTDDGNDTVTDFWNVGTGNPSYQDSDTVQFVEKLSVGNSWRWREDPHQTMYGISGMQSERNLLRYTAGDNTSDYQFQPYSNNPDANDGLCEGMILHHPVPNNVDEFEFNGWNKGAQLSPNFNKTWHWINEHDDAMKWCPADVGNVQSDIGPINNGRKTTYKCVTGTAYANHTAALGIEEFYIIVTQESYEGVDTGNPTFGIDQFNNPLRVTEGYILTSYGSNSLTSEIFNANGGIDNPYLVVRKVEKVGTSYHIYLTGYIEALDLTHIITPSGGDNVVFEQATMNGYSPNSAARLSINKAHTGIGAYTEGTPATVDPNTRNLLYAVGYTMEFVEEFWENEDIPSNPAIWETEPKDGPELDIYYEASGLIPLNINTDTSPGFIPLKDEFIYLGLPNGTFQNCTVHAPNTNTGITIPAGTEILASSGNSFQINFDMTGMTVQPFDRIHITKPDGTIFTSTITSIWDPVSGIFTGVRINSSTWGQWHTLNWHNCYSFLNGVESNRIRDNFNLPFISNGVRASSTLEEKIEKETRQYGLIFSGIYNSNSSINNLNQFIAAEKITKEINPIYGSIQKLHSRSTADGDLITLCEDRILKILATKDAVYNADGNPQLTANINVLGQAIPFVGEYGISKNPESFASESYRAYFTDKQRGAVMRLSKDGLTPISDHGMKDWFRDNLKLSNQLIGSYDDKKDEYNIALKPNHVVSFREDVRGWVSFKSFVQIESGVSMASNYYTFYQGKIYIHHYEGNNTWNRFYGITSPSTLTVLLNENPGTVKSYQTLAYEGSQAKITQDLTDNQYYNLQGKKGWWLYDIQTDMEYGKETEFIEKENKWFNYIKGGCVDGSTPQTLIGDPDSFTYQGLGVVRSGNIEIL